MSVGAVNKQTGERIPTAGLQAVDSVLSGTSTNPVQNRVVKEAFDGKQDALTFDDTPTDNSNNPVKSNGIYDSEKDIYAAIGEMGAKNLIVYPYVSSSNSYFQINSDGSITLKGANTSDQWIRVSDFYLKPGIYTMTASPSGNAYGVTIGIGSLNDQDEYTSITSTTYPNFSVSFRINEGTRVCVRLYRGANLDFTNNVVLYPMIRLASDTDGTYQSYAKTNKQLTDDVALLESEKADTDMVASDFDATASYTAGNYCIYEGKFYKFKASHSGAWSAADVDEIKIAGELASLKSGLTSAAKVCHIDVSADKTNVSSFLGYVLAKIIGDQEIGTYVVEGAWEDHDYYTGIVFKYSADTAIGMIQYGIYGGGTQNMALYSACYKTNVFSNYRTVQYSS